MTEIKMTEIWKPIDGFENYHISNMGRVKNTDTDYILISTRGKVILRKNSIHHCRHIRRLVANAFVPVPDNLKKYNPTSLHVSFKDNNSCNYRSDNLYWQVKNVWRNKTNITSSKPEITPSKPDIITEQKIYFDSLKLKYILETKRNGLIFIRSFDTLKEAYAEKK